MKTIWNKSTIISKLLIVIGFAVLAYVNCLTFDIKPGVGLLSLDMLKITTYAVTVATLGVLSLHTKPFGKLIGEIDAQHDSYAIILPKEALKLILVTGMGLTIYWTVPITNIILIASLLTVACIACLTLILAHVVILAVKGFDVIRYACRFDEIGKVIKSIFVKQ